MRNRSRALFEQRGVSFHPLFGGLTTRTDAFHFPPETRRVVHLTQVHQFVEENVITDKRRGLNQPPIQRNGATPRARTPPRSLVADSNPSNGQLMRRRKFINPGWKFRGSEFPQMLDNPRAQISTYVGHSNNLTPEPDRASQQTIASPRPDERAASPVDPPAIRCCVPRTAVPR